MKQRKTNGKGLAVLALMVVILITAPALASLDNSSFNESYDPASNATNLDLFTNLTDITQPPHNNVSNKTNTTQPIYNDTMNSSITRGENHTVNESVDVDLDVEVTKIAQENKSSQNIVSAYDDEQIRIECEFTKPMIKRGEYERVIVENLHNLANPGDPNLPFKTLNILLSQGKIVQSIEVTGNQIRMPGRFHIEPAQKPVPIGSNLRCRTLPDLSIYNSTEPYPGKLYTKQAIQEFRGYKILILNLYPVQYVPKSGGISYFDRMDVIVNLVPETANIKSKNKENFRGLPQDKARVLNLVTNPEVANAYNTPHIVTTSAQSTSIVDPADNYDYVIITSNALQSAFQPLADWKNTRGVNATVVTIENIRNNYDGSDTQDKIRNFIIDAYNNWGIEYALLGGDVEIVPVRELYVDVSPYYIPSDLYYAGLDGTWNDDGDGRYGEPGEEDLYAEVYVGRAPVNTVAEASTFVTKTKAYEDNPPADYLKKALMLGAKADSITDGGVTKDNICSEKIPGDWSITKLYERDHTASVSATTNQLNAGQHVVNHIGHASVLAIGLACTDYHQYYVAANVIGLRNAPKYFLFYTIGCYANAFDDYNDCIGEHFVKHSNGAFAFIGNTRYGWYASGYPGYYSDHFDIEFFDALYVENITNIGKTLQDSKEDLAGIALYNKWYRFCYYELALLGDPETSLSTPHSGSSPASVDAIIITADDDALTEGVQISPNPGDNKTINLSVVVSDSDGWDDIDTIMANITGPGLVADSPVSLSLVSYNGDTATYNRTFNMSFYYLNGTYTVNVSATDKSGLNGCNSTTFEYQTLTALEFAADAIAFGFVEPGETSLNKPTVQNVGNAMIDVNVSGLNMSCSVNPRHVITNDLIEVKINGSEYLNLSTARCFDVNMPVGDSSFENVYFKLNVPYGTPIGDYFGNITLTAEPS